MPIGSYDARWTFRLMQSEFLKAIKKNIKFSERPQALGANQRIVWKSAIVLLLLSRISRDNSSSLRKLNFFIWIFQTANSADVLMEIFKRNNKLAVSFLRFDPSLPRVLAYLKAAGVIQREANRYKLTDLGLIVAREISELDTVFRQEKRLLASLKKADYSETNIKRVVEGG